PARFPQSFHEPAPVKVILENRFPSVAAGHYVIKGPRKLDPNASCHCRQLISILLLVNFCTLTPFRTAVSDRGCRATNPSDTSAGAERRTRTRYLRELAFRCATPLKAFPGLLPTTNEFLASRADCRPHLP